MGLVKFIDEDGFLRIGDDGGLTEKDITFKVAGGCVEGRYEPPEGYAMALMSPCGDGEAAARARVCRMFGVELAARSRAHGRGLRTWIQIMRPGVLGQFEANPSLFDELVRNFEASDQTIPVYDHNADRGARSSSMPAEASTIGWIEELESRGAEGLWAHVEWQERALACLQAKLYLHASSSVMLGVLDPKTGEKAGARLVDVLLTNQGSELAGRL